LAAFLTGTSTKIGGKPPGAADLQQELRSLLEPDQRLLWQGFPRLGFMLRLP